MTLFCLFFLHDFESFSFPKRFIYLRGIALVDLIAETFERQGVLLHELHFRGTDSWLQGKIWVCVQVWSCSVQEICFSTLIGWSFAKVWSLSGLPKSYQKLFPSVLFIFSKIPPFYLYVTMVSPYNPQFSRANWWHAQSFFSSVAQNTFYWKPHSRKNRWPLQLWISCV